jgi:3-hydroxybutyryl-CoA dehydrogenase
MQEYAVVVGTGLMGAGIAIDLLVAGWDVGLYDVDPNGIAKARQTMAGALGRLQSIGLIDEEARGAALSRLRNDAPLDALVRGADLVIESVLEDLGVKRAIFAELDARCDAATILASNSSSFVPSLYASSTTRPDRVLGMHYFNPPYLVPCVELVVGPQTSDATVARVRGWLTDASKQVVVVRNEVPGFVANRLQAALAREALALVDRGAATPDDVDAVMRFGIGRRYAIAGPFELFDLAGLDTLSVIARGLMPDLDARRDVPASVAAAVARGDLGVKTGRGFRAWSLDSANALSQRLAAGLARFMQQDRVDLQAARLVGVWRLVTMTSEAGSGAISHPLGASPTGRLIYTASGHMSAVLAAAGRAPMASADVRAGSASEKAAAMDSFLSYAGTYEYSDGSVRHHVAMCSFQNWVGTTQERLVKLDGHRLDLSTPPIVLDGVPRVSRLVWERVAN